MALALTLPGCRSPRPELTEDCARAAAHALTALDPPGREAGEYLHRGERRAEAGGLRADHVHPPGVRHLPRGHHRVHGPRGGPSATSAPSFPLQDCRRYIPGSPPEKEPPFAAENIIFTPDIAVMCHGGCRSTAGRCIHVMVEQSSPD